jgi:hypothetical protein
MGLFLFGMRIMSAFRSRSAIALTTAALLLSAGSASAALFTATGSNADGTLVGTADITVGNGSLTVVLTDTDTGTGQRSSGQTISDVEFSVSGITAISNFTQAGSLINVNDNGTETPDCWGSDPLGILAVRD